MTPQPGKGFPSASATLTTTFDVTAERTTATSARGGSGARGAHALAAIAKQRTSAEARPWRSRDLRSNLHGFPAPAGIFIVIPLGITSWNVSKVIARVDNLP
jgi:hypothetical protein